MDRRRLCWWKAEAKGFAMQDRERNPGVAKMIAGDPIMDASAVVGCELDADAVGQSMLMVSSGGTAVDVA